MKKIFFIYLLLSTLALADTPFKYEIRFGYDLNDYTTINNKSFRHKPNLEIDFEILTELYYNLDFGFGVGIHRQTKATNVDFFENSSKEEDLGNFIPLYTTFKYKFTRKKFSPFFKTNLGYSINSSPNYFEDHGYSSKNSFYYSLGTGIEYKNFIIDYSYQVINYNAKGTNNTLDCLNKRTTLSFGYQFE